MIQETQIPANNLQNFPVLSTAITFVSETAISGSLNSTASSTFRLEFFSNDASDSSGFGEGQVFIGWKQVATDVSGNTTFTFLTSAVAAGRFITATVTDVIGGNTSEFSAGVQVTKSLSADEFSLPSGSPLGSIWTTKVGNFAIQNGQVQGNGALNVATVNGVNMADGFVQAEVGFTAIGQHAGLVARYSGPGDANMYFGSVRKTSATQVQAFIYRNVGGRWTQLSTQRVNSAGGLLRFEVVGPSLRANASLAPLKT